MCGFFQQTEVIFGQIEGDMGCVVVSKALKTFPSGSFRVGGWAYLCLSQCSEKIVAQHHPKLKATSTLWVGRRTAQSNLGKASDLRTRLATSDIMTAGCCYQGYGHTRAGPFFSPFRLKMRQLG